MEKQEFIFYNEAWNIDSEENNTDKEEYDRE